MLGSIAIFFIRIKILYILQIHQGPFANVLIFLGIFAIFIRFKFVYIFQIRQGAFAGLHSLDRLDLRHNSLERLGAEVFTGITWDDEDDDNANGDDYDDDNDDDNDDDDI